MSSQLRTLSLLARRFLLWAALFLCACASLRPAGAHPLDEAAVYHYLWVEARPRELSLQYAAQAGGLLTQAVWAQMDGDGDRQLSPEEQRRHAAGLMAALPLRIDGKPVPWKLEEYVYPSREQFFDGSFPDSVIRIRLSAPLPPPPAGGLLAGIRDETFAPFTAVFPQPVLKGFGLATGEPLVSENGRQTEFRIREGVGGTSPASPAPSNAPGPAPAAGPAAPGAKLAAPGGEGGKTTSRPLEDIDLGKAPLFPPGSKGPLSAPGPQEAHEPGLTGFLGKRLSLPLALLALGVALLAGAAHALTPGHGKTMVAAYLAGARGTVKDAVLLGLVVTITHTSSVYVLGFLCLWLTSRVRAEVVGSWLNLVSGLLVLGMGFWLFQRSLLAYYGLREADHGHAHDPAHGHSHEHGHTHSHEEEAPRPVRTPPHDSPLDDYSGSAGTRAARPPRRATRWDIVSLGVAGGLVPCTDGLAILIAAANLGSIGIGLAIIAAFSVGMAAVLVALGILTVRAKGLVERFSGERRWVRALPVASGGLLCLIGAWLTFEALVRTGFLRIG